MNDDAKSHEGEDVPCAGKGQFVKHKGRTRFVYLDSNLNWRDCYTNELLEGEVSKLDKV